MLRVSSWLLVPVLLAAPAATSGRFSYSTFREESGRLVAFVDGYPASVSGSDAFVPIPIAVALVKSGKSLTFTPESFTLIDAQGNAVPAAGFRELTTGYGRLTFDRSLLRMRPLEVATSITELLRVPSRFYPAPGQGTRIERVHLAPQTWFEDVLYFPRPQAGLAGPLTLRIHAGGEPPVEVRFSATSDELARR